MKKINVFVSFSACFLIFSCGNPLKEELEVSQKKLMDLHDEVMPKTMKINKLKADLAAFGDENSDNDSLKILVIDASLKMQQASDDMYAWMEDFGLAIKEDKDLEKKKQEFDALLPEIERIKKDTDESMDKAKSILGR